MVRAALQGGVNGTILPPAFQTPIRARLADQIELIKITPAEPLDGRHVEAVDGAADPLPHHRRLPGLGRADRARRCPSARRCRCCRAGRSIRLTGRDAGVFVQPELPPADAHAAACRRRASGPAMRLGDAADASRATSSTAASAQRALHRARTAARSSSSRPTRPPTPGRLQVELPQGAPLPAGLAAGRDRRRSRRLADRRLSGRGGARSRAPRRARRPTGCPSRWPRAPRRPPRPMPGGARITVACEPPIRAGPAAVHRRRPAGAAAASRSAATPTRSTRCSPGLPSGTTLPVRLRVAGIDSLLIDPAARAAALRPDPTGGDAMNHVPQRRLGRGEPAPARRGAREALGRGSSGGEPLARGRRRDLDAAGPPRQPRRRSSASARRAPSCCSSPRRRSSIRRARSQRPSGRRSALALAARRRGACGPRSARSRRCGAGG